MIRHNLSKITHFYVYYKYFMFLYMNDMAIDSIFLLDVYSKDIFEFLVFWAILGQKDCMANVKLFFAIKNSI